MKTLYRNLLVVLFTLTFCQSIYAVILPEQSAQGKVLRTEKDTVLVLDRFGQKLSVPRTDILSPKNGNWVVGDQVTFRLVFKSINSEPLKMPSEKEWLKMNYLDKEKIWLAIFRFHKQIEDKSSKRDKKHNQVQEGTQDTTWLNFFFDQATANPSANGCFYAGWPSTLIKAPSATDLTTQCRAAWSTHASGYHNCGGGDNVFRCNPDLFGPGTRHTGAGQLGSAAAPFPSCTVQTFPTKSHQNGICVKVEGNDSILKNCYEAALMNIPNFVSRPGYLDTLRRMAVQINKYCEAPDLPEGIAADQQEAAKTALLQDRQQECQYLKAQISAVGFHAKKPERRCVVVSSEVPTDRAEAESACRELKVICIRGNVTYQGYIGRKQYQEWVRDTITTVAPVAADAPAALRINQLRPNCTTDQANCYDKPFYLPMPGHLYSRPCSDKSSEIVDSYSQCEPYAFNQQSLGENFRGSSSEACSGEYCVVNGKCARPAAINERSTFMEVTAVCRCHTTGPYKIVDNLQTCLSSEGDIQGITATPDGQDFKPFTDGTSTVIER